MNRQERRRRRRIRRICTTIILALLGIIIFSLILRLKTLSAFKGEYVRSIDVTDSVVAGVALWLKDVEGADITTEWIKEQLDDELKITVHLTFERKGLSSGTCNEAAGRDSYEECREKSFALTCDCLRKLLIKRLEAVGYTGSLSDADTDALISEALGMPLGDYIKNAGVEVIPPFEEFQDEVSRSGDYRIKGSRIELKTGDKVIKDSYAVTGDSIAFPSRGLVYSRAADDKDSDGKKNNGENSNEKDGDGSDDKDSSKDSNGENSNEKDSGENESNEGSAEPSESVDTVNEDEGNETVVISTPDDVKE